MVRHNLLGDIFMLDHNILSESEEMYLVTIRKICESCADTPIPIPDMAAALGVMPVSVNQMIKKLSEVGLVEYTPYKGVELTEEGRQISTKILRHRRLWEVFLVGELKMNLDEADTLTCRLEHLTTEDVARRLSLFLGNPAVCFHGSPIYPGDGSQPLVEIPLTQIKVGQCCYVIRVEADENTCAFLAEEGVSAGQKISVNASGNLGSTLLENSEGNQVIVAPNIIEKIFVEAILE
jgi:DtxR family transcriptional regulator, Mn-dependent transcriptional regulator